MVDILDNFQPMFLILINYIYIEHIYLQKFFRIFAENQSLNEL